MRLWSIHPSYLDSKGLVALWRETLLAKKVLEKKTAGYKNHPQLIRFKEQKEPLKAINCYLMDVLYEAENRGYSFDTNKIDWNFDKDLQIAVTTGQLEYERIHLKEKLKVRDQIKFEALIKEDQLKTHPVFFGIQGPIEGWEVVKN